MVWFMLFNATFNNISVILLQHGPRGLLDYVKRELSAILVAQNLWIWNCLCVYLLLFQKYEKPILYINKNLYLKVCNIFNNLLPKMGFSPFSLSVQAGKKGGWNSKLQMLITFLSITQFSQARTQHAQLN